MSKVKKIVWKEGADKDLAFIDYKIASFYFGVTFVISVISAWSEFPALVNRLGNFWLALLSVVAIEILTNWFLNLGGFLMYLTFKKFSIGYLIGTIVFLSIATGLYLGSRSLSNEGAGIRIDNYIEAPEKAEKDSSSYILAITGLSAKEQGEISNLKDEFKTKLKEDSKHLYVNKKRYPYSPLKFSLSNVSSEIEKHKGYSKGHYKDNTRVALIKYKKSMNNELDGIKSRNKKDLESAIEIIQGKYEGLRGEKAIVLSDSFEKIDNNFTNAEDAYKAKKSKYQSFTNVIVWFLMSVLALFHLGFFGSKIASKSEAEYQLVDSTDWVGLVKGTFTGINIWLFNGISRLSKAAVGEEGVINRYRFDTKSQDTIDEDNRKKEEEAQKQIEKDLKNKEHLEKMRLIEEEKQKILRELKEQKQKTETERQERLKLEEQNKKQEQEFKQKQKQLEEQKRLIEKQNSEKSTKKLAKNISLSFVKQDVTLNKLIETISRETKFYSKTTIEDLNDEKFKEATEVFLKDNIYNWYKRQFKSGSTEKSVETNTIKYKLAKYHLEKHQYDVSVDEGGSLKVVPKESKSKIA